MPRGTEPTPRDYARLVASTMKSIADDRGTSNRALAKHMLVGEKYLRDRFAAEPAFSFTVGDVERFAAVYRIDAAWFLADPTAARDFLLSEVSSVSGSLDDVTFTVDAPKSSVALAAKKGTRKADQQPPAE